jgi:Transglycosylase SLT domain
MTWTRPIRLAGTALGALLLGAAVLVPAPLGAGLRPLQHADLSAWLEPGREPGPPGWVERVDVQLEIRMPELGDADRRRLARTLVLEAELAKIDPLLVLALIEVESAYDVDARSGRGAVGLMQLREPTLRREVERAGLDWADPSDPATNLRAGIRYLRRLLDAFGRRDVDLALMAYNAGPNRILGYLREGDGEIPARFHAYPRKVRAELRRLRRAFGEERATELASADPLPAR